MLLQGRIGSWALGFAVCRNSEREGVGEVETDVVALQIFEHAEEREIGFSGCFVEPLHAVRPGAVIDDVRQMRVQGEGKESCWAVCRCLSHDEHLSRNFRLGAAGGEPACRS